MRSTAMRKAGRNRQDALTRRGVLGMAVRGAGAAATGAVAHRKVPPSRVARNLTAPKPDPYGFFRPSKNVEDHRNRYQGPDLMASNRQADRSDGVGDIVNAVKKVGQRMGRRYGNWKDRRGIKQAHREVEWARGGEADAKLYGTQWAKKMGYAEPGFWAGREKLEQKKIKTLEHRIKQRGDCGVMPMPRRDSGTPTVKYTLDPSLGSYGKDNPVNPKAVINTNEFAKLGSRIDALGARCDAMSARCDDWSSAASKAKQIAGGVVRATRRFANRDETTGKRLPQPGPFRRFPEQETVEQRADAPTSLATRYNPPTPMFRRSQGEKDLAERGGALQERKLQKEVRRNVPEDRVARIEDKYKPLIESREGLAKSRREQGMPIKSAYHQYRAGRYGKKLLNKTNREKFRSGSDVSPGEFLKRASEAAPARHDAIFGRSKKGGSAGLMPAGPSFVEKSAKQPRQPAQRVRRAPTGMALRATQRSARRETNPMRRAAFQMNANQMAFERKLEKNLKRLKRRDSARNDVDPLTATGLAVGGAALYHGGKAAVKGGMEVMRRHVYG